MWNNSVALKSQFYDLFKSAIRVKGTILKHRDDVINQNEKGGSNTICWKILKKK